MMLYTIFIHSLAAIAFGTLAISYFKKEKKQILFYQIISYIFFTLHYYLLNGVTGAICNFIGLLALITIYIFEKKKYKSKIVVSSIFIILLLVINIMTFQNIYSIFPMIASVIIIIAFLNDNENIIRTTGFISTLCWLIYAIVYKSYVSIIFEAITLIEIFIALIKYLYIKKKGSEKIEGK